MLYVAVVYFSRYTICYLLWEHASMDASTLLLIGFWIPTGFCYCLQCSCEHSHIHFLLQMCKSFSWGILKSRAICHKIRECSTSGDNDKLFSKVVLSVHSHEQCEEEPVLPHLSRAGFVIFNQLSGCQMLSPWGLGLHFQTTNGVEHIFKCLKLHPTLKGLFMSFTHFLYQINLFLLAHRHSLYGLDTIPLSVCEWQISSPSFYYFSLQNGFG